MGGGASPFGILRYRNIFLMQHVPSSTEVSRRFRDDFLVLLTGSTLGQLILILSVPVISRLYSPSAVGAFGAFSALESILFVVACLRYDQAIAITPRRDEAVALLRLSLWIAGCFALVVALVFCFVSPSVKLELGVSGIPFFAPLLGATLFATAAVRALTLWSIRTGLLGSVARSRFALSISQAGGQSVGGAAGAGSGGLALGYFIGRMVAVTYLWLRVRNDIKLGHRTMGRMAREAWRFPLYLAPSALLNAVSLQLPTLLVASRYGVVALGSFVLATRVASVSVHLLSQPVSEALLARFVRNHDLATADLRRDVKAVCARLLPLAMLVSVPLVIGGPQITQLVLGDRWASAGELARVLAPAFALQLIVSPLAVVLVAKRRQLVQLGWDAMRLVLVAVAVLVPAGAGADLLTAATWLSASLCSTYLVLLVLILRAARPSRVVISEKRQFWRA